MQVAGNSHLKIWVPGILHIIYIYSWNLCVLYFEAQTIQNKVLSNQNKGHLGSRYIYSIFHPQDFCFRCILALMLGSFILCLIRNLVLGFPGIKSTHRKGIYSESGPFFWINPNKKTEFHGRFFHYPGNEKNILGRLRLGLFVWVFFGDDILPSYTEIITSHE